MNKTLIKNLNPRRKIYLAIISFIVIAVFVRITLVDFDRGRIIVSFIAEWSRFGRPVTVEKIIPQDVPVYTKLTVRVAGGSQASGFVTADIQDKLQQGQEVFYTDKAKPCGKIVSTGRELDMDTGMFPVGIEFNQEMQPEELVVVFVCTQTIPKVLVVPNEILDLSGSEYYLWKVEDSRARKVRVKIGASNGYGAVINEGINPGDLIVFNGRSMLSENGLVRVISNVPLRQTYSKGRLR
jgi:hypothetical protein